jgi:uncharacterized protein
MTSRTDKNLKRFAWIIMAGFILINAIASFHAYRFSHFTNTPLEKTTDPRKLSTLKKIKTLLTGINNPRPKNTLMPDRYYETIKLKSNKEIEGWRFKVENAKGTVILFHGFGGQKSFMLDKSDVFLKLGYNTMLVDFMGSGGSEGNQTTIGYKEAEEVKTCFDYLRRNGEKKIYLFGTSMGAVAILKAINDYAISPEAIIIECPFGSMYQTVCARFKSMNVPAFPMAGLLVFWGGIENGYWAFSFKPSDYAKNISCPTLLLYGEKDERVSRQEIDEIYSNLNCSKALKIFPNAGHENYLIKYKQEWSKDIEDFLRKLSLTPIGVGNDTKKGI